MIKAPPPVSIFQQSFSTSDKILEKVISPFLGALAVLDPERELSDALSLSALVRGSRSFWQALEPT